MYVCMYVCTYVCRYVCIYVCMYVCKYVCTYVGTKNYNYYDLKFYLIVIDGMFVEATHGL